MATKTIQLEQVKTKDELQPRVSLNLFAVQDYAEAMKEGRTFPPIEVVWDGESYWLWDGFHRKKAAEQAGLVEIDASVTEGTLEDAQWLALSANKVHGMRRSNEDKGRAVELALGHPNGASLSDRQIAEHCGVSHPFVGSIRKELENRVTGNGYQLHDSSYRNGKDGKSRILTRPAPSIISEALDLLRYTDIAEDKRQIRILSEYPDPLQIAAAQKIAEGEARTVIEARRQVIVENTPEPPPLTGKYRVIYADPPWKYGNTMPDYFTEQADHYPPMALAEITALPVSDIAEDDAVLFIWVTSPILEESFQVINAWGFKYKASFVWDKVKHNMGHYNSVRHEFLLVCVRGSCQPDVAQLFDSVQSIERAEHSKKPEKFREIIDTIYPKGNRIELFARRLTPNWEVYGNECESTQSVPLSE